MRVITNNPSPSVNLCLLALSTRIARPTPFIRALVLPDETAIGVNIEFLMNRPTSPAGRFCEVDESSISPRHVDGNEVTQVLVNVLLHGVSSIDAFADFAEHLPPRTADLSLKIPS